KLAVGGKVISSDLEYYYVVWGVTLLLFALAQNLVRSRVGRALRAIHTSETAAAVLGVDTGRYKTFVFVLSAFYAAVAGALYAHYVTFVSPGTFGFHASVLLVTMVVLGGMASLWGAVLGALFLTLLPEALRAIENLDILVYGAILVLCMMYLPGGLVEGAQKGWGAVRALTRRGTAPQAGGAPR
ncbi:MAG: branched-chain amino acid ABC transporter permease, partial [Verrucomicrobiota bacterium]